MTLPYSGRRIATPVYALARNDGRGELPLRWTELFVGNGLIRSWQSRKCISCDACWLAVKNPQPGETGWGSIVNKY